MADVYYPDRHTSWHLCFTFRDFQDTRSFIKDVGKCNRKVSTGLSCGKLNQSEKPDVVSTVFKEKEILIRLEKWLKPLTAKNIKGPTMAGLLKCLIRVVSRLLEMLEV